MIFWLLPSRQLGESLTVKIISCSTFFLNSKIYYLDIIDMSQTNAVSTDFSVYVTIMNQTNSDLQLISQKNSYGQYNPTNLPPSISKQVGQIFFTLQGNWLTGSEGSVTYSVVGEGKSITFAYQCPRVSDNSISVTLNQTDFTVNYYGTNKIINWNPDGLNWVPVNNFPPRGHPLSVLFVVSELQ